MNPRSRHDGAVTFDRRIGRYRLERALGSGAFSTVWLALDEDLQDLVALKILADNWSQNDDARRRFGEEARALRRLDGDRIVRLYELAQLPDGRPFMVMEFADRGSLEDRMRFATQTGSPFSVSEVAALGIELAGCLASVHAGRIVHRDVKPSNVLFRTVPPEAQEALRRTGRPAPSERMLLGDFGIARRMETEGLTHIVGSPQYMAPEQADASTAHRVDARADIYSAGVVLFELLAGSPPRSDGELAVIDDEAANDPMSASRPIGDVRDVREVRPDVPPSLASAIGRAIAKERDQRYMTAWELRQDLVRSLGEPVHPNQAARARPAAWAGTTAALPAATMTDIVQTATPSVSATRVAPSRPDTPPSPAAETSAAQAAGAPARRLGALDTCVLDAVAGIVLVIASVLPWRSANGTGLLTGIDGPPGRIAFAAGGALVLAAVIRWAARGKWGLRTARLLSDLAGFAAFTAIGIELATSTGAIGAIFDRGVHARLGVGVMLTAAGGVLAFVAAGRAKRQLRAIRFRLLAAHGPAAAPAATASPSGHVRNVPQSGA